MVPHLDKIGTTANIFSYNNICRQNKVKSILNSMILSYSTHTTVTITE